MSAVTDAVRELALPVVERQGCALWDVEYVKEAGNWYLRVYIDRPEGVSINDCEAVSRELDPILDSRESLIAGSYTFEVASAGLERRLRGSEDFNTFAGRFAEIKLYKPFDGKKSYLGTLAGSKDGAVEIDAGGKRYSFLETDIAGAWLRLE